MCVHFLLGLTSTYPHCSDPSGVFLAAMTPLLITDTRNRTQKNRTRWDFPIFPLSEKYQKPTSEIKS